jgi:hypothetical protein
MISALPMAPDSRRERPIPLHCPTCGQRMSFHTKRTEPDENGREDHVRVYFCIQHGFFHLSDREEITPGM